MDETKQYEDLNVTAPDGSSIPLASLWRDRSVVLVLVRHFG